MANVLTISAPNGDWPTITLGPGDDHLPKMIEGRLGHGEPVRMLFRSPTIRTREAQIRALAVPLHALVNGEPDRAMNGRSFAQTLAGGRLVTLSLQEGGLELSDSGIMVVAHSSLGPGGPLAQSLELVFYPMAPGSRLYSASGTFEELPDDADGDGEGE